MIEIEGLAELNIKLSQLARVCEETARNEISDIAMDLASKSSQSAPVLNGDLRGDLATPKKDGDMSWMIGSSLPYTRRQHEETWYNHPRGGGAKFIEKPFRSNQQKYIKELGNAIERKLK